MVSKTRLLLLLDPADAFNVDASEKKVNEITGMMDKEWEIHLTASRKVSYRKLTCNYKLHKVPLISGLNSMLSRMLYLFFSIWTGVRTIRNYDIQAIMTTGGHLHMGLVAYLISRITGRKSIVRVNEDDVLAIILFIKMFHKSISSSKMLLRTLESILRKMESFVLKHVDWILTQGPMDYEKIRQITTNITFVPLWINTEKFHPISEKLVRPLKKQLIEQSDDRVILFVGRLHPEKDVETLLYGFKRLLKIHKDVILVVVGTGPEEEKYKELSKKLGIISKVKFSGYVPHDQISKYYNVADVYVLTSIREEWSNTVMEAMACETPVIATNVGGNPYLVKDGETGFLIPPKSPDALAEKMAYVLDHLNEVKKIASNACLSVKKFHKQDIGELYKKTIAGVIEDKAPDGLFLVQGHKQSILDTHK